MGSLNLTGDCSAHRSQSKCETGFLRESNDWNGPRFARPCASPYTFCAPGFAIPHSAESGRKVITMRFIRAALATAVFLWSLTGLANAAASPVDLEHSSLTIRV